jgi:Holliday junction resolvase RusA-like endonuclease
MLPEIKDYRFNYEIDTDPVAKGRARFTSRGHAYTPSKTRVAENTIATKIIKQVDHEPLECALAMRVIFYVNRPKSVSKKKRPLPVAKPDLSNYIKIIEDALNGIVFKDDSQIVTIQAWKLYADDCEPRIIVSFEPIE